MQFLETYSTDPEYNLAFEAYCFQHLPVQNDSYFFLWINSPAIIIGKNQNAYAEINIDYVNKHNIKVVRRITGGGAVYHDLGNLNFSFIEASPDSKKIDFKKYYSYIITAFRELGLPAELSGRNDITINGKKCVGASQAIRNNRTLSNGCILFDVKLDELAKALTVRPEKLQAKGVKSVSARVGNLIGALDRPITIEAFKRHLLNSIFKQRGEVPHEYQLSAEELAGVKKIYDERFSLKSWNYGKSLTAQCHNYRYFPHGAIEVFFDVEKGCLQNVSILGDFFSIADLNELEQQLIGTPYEAETLKKKFETVDLEKYFGPMSSDDITALFFDLN